MAVSATLRTTEVPVIPGAAARCHVLVRNNSAVVDQFVFAVLGDVEGWTQVKPDRANLMPHQEIGVELTFNPPRSSEVLAGEHPFALQVASREDPGGSVVQEGLVTVAPFTELDVGVVPLTSSGRRGGKHTVAVDNLGNHEHPVEIDATDPDAKLTFRMRPHRPVVAPGSTAFVRLRVRPKKYFWKGVDQRIPFVVTLGAPDIEPLEVKAAFEQGPLIPRRFFWLFSLLIALLLLLVLIVSTLLRQRPVSIAGPSPAFSSTPARPSTTAATTSSAATSTTAPAVGTGAAAAPAGGPGRTVRTTGGGAASAVTTTFTIDTESYPNVGGGPQLFSYVVPTGPHRRVTSVVLRNPAADVGGVQIRHGDRVVGTIDLATVNRDGRTEVTFRPDNPPLAAPGERITLAVSCANSRDPCTPSAVFTAALVR